MKQTKDKSRRGFLKLSSVAGLAFAFSPGNIRERTGGAVVQFRLLVFSTRSVGLILAVAFKPRFRRDKTPRRFSDD